MDSIEQSCRRGDPEIIFACVSCISSLLSTLKELISGKGINERYVEKINSCFPTLLSADYSGKGSSNANRLDRYLNDFILPLWFQGYLLTTRDLDCRMLIERYSSLKCPLIMLVTRVEVVVVTVVARLKVPKKGWMTPTWVMKVILVGRNLFCTISTFLFIL